MNNGIKNGLHERTFGTMSSNKSRSLVASVILSGLVAFGSFGASASAGSRRGPDLRGQTVLTAAAPQPVVAGPARLIHVDVEGARVVSLYSVASGNGGVDACRAGASAGKRALRTNASNELDLDVVAGQTVCLSAAGGSVQVAWHAQQPAGTLGILQASNR
jgi:hypothetical protein